MAKPPPPAQNHPVAKTLKELAGSARERSREAGTSFGRKMQLFGRFTGPPRYVFRHTGAADRVVGLALYWHQPFEGTRSVPRNGRAKPQSPRTSRKLSLR